MRYSSENDYFPSNSFVDPANDQCIVCGKATTFCCSRCMRVYYCSQGCQRIDWRSHKLTCTEPLPSNHESAPSADASATSRISLLPEPSRSLADTITAYDKAGDLLKQGLMSRFGSIVGAYEWFDSNTDGLIDLRQFELTLASAGVTDSDQVRAHFAALDRQGFLSISLSQFLSEAVKKLKSPFIQERAPTPPSPHVPVSTAPLLQAESFRIPPGRRALRTAAILAFRNGRYDDAIVAAQQSLGITGSNVVKSAASIARSAENLVELLLLSRAFFVTKQFTKGESLLAVIGDIVRLLPAVSDQDSAYPPHVRGTLLCSVGEIFDEYKKKSEAEFFFDQYLEIVRSSFGPTSLPYGDAATVVAAFCVRNKLTDRAIALSETARSIRAASLPSPHARLADSLANLGIALRQGGQLFEAVSMFVEAAQQRSELFGPQSRPMADIQYLIAATCFEIKNFQEAEIQINLAHQTRLSLLGPTHPDSLAAAELGRRISAGIGKEGVKKKKSVLDLKPDVVGIVGGGGQQVQSEVAVKAAEALAGATVAATVVTPVAAPVVAPVAAAAIAEKEVDKSGLNLEAVAVLDEVIKRQEEVLLRAPIESISSDSSSDSSDSDSSSSDFSSESSEEEETNSKIPDPVEHSEDDDSDGDAEEDKGSEDNDSEDNDSEEAGKDEGGGWTDPEVEVEVDFAHPIGSVSPSFVRSSTLAETRALALRAPISLAFGTRSPFSEAHDRVGPNEFTRALFELDPSVIDRIDFTVWTGMPVRAAFWVPIALKGIYVKRVIASELRGENRGTLIERFFTAVKRNEISVRQIFRLLSNVKRNIAASTGGASRLGTMLTMTTRLVEGKSPVSHTVELPTFSTLINSRTRNIALMEYFTGQLKERSPTVLEDVVECLSLAAKVAKLDVADYLDRLETVRKSVVRIDSDFSQMDETSGGPTEEGGVVLAVVAMKPEIKALRVSLDNRVTLTAQGIAVVLEVFSIHKSVIMDQIDEAVDKLAEFHDLLVKYSEVDEGEGGEVEDEESGEDDEESGEDEEESEEEESEEGSEDDEVIIK